MSSYIYSSAAEGYVWMKIVPNSQSAMYEVKPVTLDSV